MTFHHLEPEQTCDREIPSQANFPSPLPAESMSAITTATRLLPLRASFLFLEIKSRECGYYWGSGKWALHSTMVLARSASKEDLDFGEVGHGRHPTIPTLGDHKYTL